MALTNFLLNKMEVNKTFPAVQICKMLAVTEKLYYCQIFCRTKVRANNPFTAVKHCKTFATVVQNRNTNFLKTF